MCFECSQLYFCDIIKKTNLHALLWGGKKGKEMLYLVSLRLQNAFLSNILSCFKVVFFTNLNVNQFYMHIFVSYLNITDNKC